MKAVAEVIGVSRSNLIERLRDRPKKRLGRPPLPDDELMADIKLGLYVNELIGMGVNGITGDYSRGAAGFMIRNGVLAEPVAELVC